MEKTKATTKTYYHPTGFFLIWSKSMQHWYLGKVLKSGKVKKHFVDGFSYKPDWKQAVADIRKKGLRIPASTQGWKRQKVTFDNTIKGFEGALIQAHLEN
jgi:hypothetical protein